MPGWNECGIYNASCRNQTCAHPTNPRNRDKTKCQSAGPHGIGKYDCSCPLIVSGGVQCRTMLSQRPCGAHDCTREECSGKAPNMCDTCGVSQGSRDWCEYCGQDTTPPREPLRAPESDERTTETGEPLYALTGLSRRLADSLGAILEAAWESPSYPHLMDDAEILLSMFRAQVGKTHNEYACMHYDDGCRCECPDCN